MLLESSTAVAAAHDNTLTAAPLGATGAAGDASHVAATAAVAAASTAAAPVLDAATGDAAAAAASGGVAASATGAVRERCLQAHVFTVAVRAQGSLFAELPSFRIRRARSPSRDSAAARRGAKVRMPISRRHTLSGRRRSVRATATATMPSCPSRHRCRRHLRAARNRSTAMRQQRATRARRALVVATSLQSTTTISCDRPRACSSSISLDARRRFARRRHRCAVCARGRAVARVMTCVGCRPISRDSSCRRPTHNVPSRRVARCVSLPLLLLVTSRVAVVGASNGRVARCRRACVL
jgi:hypothetical protein